MKHPNFFYLGAVMALLAVFIVTHVVKTSRKDYMDTPEGALFQNAVVLMGAAIAGLWTLLTVIVITAAYLKPTL